MSFVFKTYRQGDNVLLAVADRELIGKKIGGSLVSEFYGDESIGKEVSKLFKEATSMNLLGKDIVELAVKNGFIDSENVIELEGVPHALFFKL